MLSWLSETGKIWGLQAFWSHCGFSSLWCPFGWNWSYLGFLGIIWSTCGSKCRGEGGGIFPTLCVECCLVFLLFDFIFLWTVYIIFLYETDQIRFIIGQLSGCWWPGAFTPGHQLPQCWVCTHEFPAGWFNKKMPSYQYRKSHCGDKTILRQSYLHNGISYTGKTASLYWIRAQVFMG